MTLFHDPLTDNPIDAIEDRALPPSVPVVMPLALAGSLALGAFVVSGGSIALMGAVSAPVVTYGFLKVKNWMSAKAFERRYGFVSYLIDSEKDMVQYLRLKGDKKVAQELLTAYESGQELTRTALKTLERLQPSLPPTSLEGYLEAIEPMDAEVVHETKGLLKPSETPSGDVVLGDLVSYMTDPLKPTIVSAVPRAGKGFLANQVIKAAKTQGYTVWVLQPKPSQQELHYWQQVDRFLGVPLEQYQPDSPGVTELITSFLQEWRSQGSKTLLVIDELIKLEAMLPKWYKSWLIPFLKVEGSTGETEGRVCYLLTQSPLVSDLGLSSGNRAAYEMLALEKATTQEHLEAIRSSYKALKSLPEPAEYSKSPVGVLAYYSRSNGFHPIPKYTLEPIGSNALCPELAEWVYGATDDLYGDSEPTVQTATSSVPVVKEPTEVDLAVESALELLEGSGKPLSLAKLVPQASQRRRIGSDVAKALQEVPGVKMETVKKGSVTSMLFSYHDDDDHDDDHGGHGELSPL